MKMKLVIPFVAASMMMGGTALAEQGKKDRNQSTSVAAGVAGASRDGAVAGGVGATQSAQARKRNQDRRGSRDERNQPQVNSATTSTSGAVHTTRRSGSAAITTSGAAQGTGTVRSSSEGDVYSSTDRDGSTADAYGRSESEAREQQRRSRPR